jgi:pyruvate/2-oxoglutarate dehydrogenase complex dihydrolipoamide dehydrogenase (E3) component
MYRPNDLLLVHDQYTGQLYKFDKLLRKRRIAQIGNTGIAYDFVSYLEKLGHRVHIIDNSDKEGD